MPRLDVCKPPTELPPPRTGGKQTGGKQTGAKPPTAPPQTGGARSNAISTGGKPPTAQANAISTGGKQSNEMSIGDRLFPVFLKLQGRNVVVVGGSLVAAGKIGALVDAGAVVTVIAPEVAPEVERSGARIEKRAFSASDLDGAWLVVAAATADVNREVADAAESRRVFVNAVDDPERASVYTGGVFRKGGVTVAISTEGKAPALAGLLREGLEAAVPDDVESWVSEARVLRARQRAEGIPMSSRRPLLLEALNRLYQAKAGAGV